MATLNLSSLGDCSTGVCLDTSAVPIAASSPPFVSMVNADTSMENLPLTGPQYADILNTAGVTPGIDPNAGCYPASFVGPLPTGASYCPGAPASPASPIPWGTLAAVLGGIVLVSMMGGRH